MPLRRLLRFGHAHRVFFELDAGLRQLVLKLGTLTLPLLALGSQGIKLSLQARA